MNSTELLVPKRDQARGTAAKPNALIGGAISPMPITFARRLAQAGWLLIVALSIGIFVVSVPARALQLLQVGITTVSSLKVLGLPVGFVGYYVGTLDAILFLAFVSIGILIFWCKPDEWISLFASLFLITTATAIVRPPDSLRALDTIYHLPLILTLILGTSSALLFVPIFPDGRFAPRWSAIPILATVIYTIIYYVVPAIGAHTVPWSPPELSPITILGLAVAFIAQVYRYRRLSSAPQRQQTKWVIAGIGAAVTGLLLFQIVVPALFPEVHQPGSIRLAYVLLGVPFLYISLLSFPLALAWSILRFRLWNINLLVTGTLVYILLSAILAGLFAVFETIAKSFFVALTGEQSQFSVIMATLVVAASFTPIKSGLDTLVSKRFKGQGDPAKPLSEFTDDIQRRVSTVHPQQITQRLLEEAVNAFGAKGGRALLKGEGPLSVVFLSGDFDEVAEVTVFYRTDAVEFGEIALGARMSGQPYSAQDRTLLESTATIVACAIYEDKFNTLGAHMGISIDHASAVR